MAVSAVDWDIDWRGQAAMTSTSGGEQTIYQAMPRWIGAPTLWLTRDQISAWRALRATARGRIAVYRVPMIDPLGFDLMAHAQNAAQIHEGIMHEGGAPFSSGMGYAFAPFVPCAADAAAGASELLVDEAALPVPVKVGALISYQDRPYRIAWRAAEGAHTRLGIEMPLRAPIAAGALIDLEAKGLFIAQSDDMGNATYDRNFRATVALQLREWLQ